MVFYENGSGKAAPGVESGPLASSLPSLAENNFLSLVWMRLKGTWTFAFLLTALIIGFSLRTIGLGSVFQSSDNVEKAVQLLDGEGWMLFIHSTYGVLYHIWMNVAASFISSLGISLTEFWWRFPVALMGTAQIILSYFFLKFLKFSRKESALFALLIACFPLHVMQSRYLYGYEVFGVFFLTLFLWKFFAYLKAPSIRTGLRASAYFALYLASHVDIIPIFFGIVWILFIEALFSREGSSTIKLCGGKILRLFAHLIWLVPLVTVSPFLIMPIRHALEQKPRFGFYLDDYFEGFLGNMGIPLFLFVIIGALITAYLFLNSKKTFRDKSKEPLIFWGLGAGYLLPLFFGAPPGVTVIRGYMLVGTYLLFLASFAAIFRLPFSKKEFHLAYIFGIIIAIFSVWGTAESIFWRDHGFDPTFTLVERGVVPVDPGTKASGYLIRNYLKTETPVLAIDRAVEPPNFRYYFGFQQNGFSAFDLDLSQTRRFLEAHQAEADVIVLEPDQEKWMFGLKGFDRRVVLTAEGKPTQLIYARTSVSLPHLESDVRALNEKFDRDYPIHLSLVERWPKIVWPKTNPKTNADRWPRIVWPKMKNGM